MFISHDSVKNFVAEHLEELTNWSLLEIESPFFRGKRVDILAHDGANFVAIEIKLNVTKDDVDQIARYTEYVKETPNVRLALLGATFNNIVCVPPEVELWQLMMSIGYHIDKGVPRYNVQQLSVAPYNIQTRRIDERFLVAANQVEKKESVSSNPLLNHPYRQRYRQ